MAAEPYHRTMSPRSRSLRAQISGTHSRRELSAEDHARLDEIRTEYRTSHAEDYLRQVLAAAPPLSDNQKRQIAGVLLSSYDAEDAAAAVAEGGVA